MLLLYILLAIVVIVALFLAYVAMKPGDFRIQRSSSINAAPAVVFAQVNDFHAWDAWSPWAKRDPNAKNSFEGAPSGAGAIFKWSGNKEVGQGQMTLTESKPNSLIRIKLDFFAPFACSHQAEFTFSPEGQGTNVTWSMIGTNSFIGKIFCTFMNMDKMIGGDFEKGLQSMKAVAEGGGAKS